MDLNLENKEKQKALETAVTKIEKQFGKGAVMLLGENTKLDIESIPTGCLSLDIALGIGGIPKGRIIEIYGPESSGKTTLALHIVAEAQKLGGIAAFIDAEHALDPQYAKALGVDEKNLIISQPDSGEQALEIAEHLIRSNAVSVIIIDSVAALTPKAEIDGEMGDAMVGRHARLMSQALRNQLREKIGVSFGNPETTTGGRALRFYSSVRLDIRKIETLKQGDEMIGNRVKVKVAKNKVAPPFKQVEFDIMYGKGISRTGILIDMGVDYGFVQKSGSWYSYGDEKLGQGRENAKDFLEQNKNIADEIEFKIRETLKPKEEDKAEVKEEKEDLDQGFLE